MRTKTCKVQLTKGYFATIDAADAELVNQYKWYAKDIGRAVYAATRLKEDRTKVLLMHRLIAGAARGCNVRFRNFNTLDLRRKNLQPTPPQVSL